MVCGAGGMTVKFRVTVGAGRMSGNCAFPDWLAAIEQRPPLTVNTAVPPPPLFMLGFGPTVQTFGVVELKMTGRPELAVALILKGVTPKATLLSGANVMVCAVPALSFPSRTLVFCWRLL